MKVKEGCSFGLLGISRREKDPSFGTISRVEDDNASTASFGRDPENLAARNTFPFRPLQEAIPFHI